MSPFAANSAIASYAQWLVGVSANGCAKAGAIMTKTSAVASAIAHCLMWLFPLAYSMSGASGAQERECPCFLHAQRSPVNARVYLPSGLTLPRLPSSPGEPRLRPWGRGPWDWLELGSWLWLSYALRPKPCWGQANTT